MTNKTLLMSLGVMGVVGSVILWGGRVWTQHSKTFAQKTAVEMIYPDVPLLPVAPIPVFTTATSSAVDISAQAAIAIDLSSQVPLYEKNAAQLHFPASTVKMMTAIVARKNMSLDQILTISLEDVTESNSLDLAVGEVLTVADLIQALLISSSNEAAQVLANHSPYGPTNFLTQMNRQAIAFGLTNTHFVSPEGFDEDGQNSSARDLAILAQKLLEDNYLRSLVSLPRTTVSALDGTIHELINTNQFLSQAPTLHLQDGRVLPTKFYGIKTGTTPLAGEVLVTAVEVEARDILLVVLKSQNRYNDSQALLTWIMDNYEWLDYGQ